MLKLHVSPTGDIGTMRAVSWGWEGHGVMVAPLVNPALVTQARLRSDEFELSIREASQHTDAAMLDSWPLEFLHLRICRDASGISVSLRCGEWGTCPIYMTTASGSLDAHWDAVELYSQQPRAILSFEYAAHFLVRLDDIYSVNTVFPNIQRLTALSTAKWRAETGKLTFTEPAPVLPPAPHALVEGADVLGALDRTLIASGSRYKSDHVHCGALLSGGLDSSIVALTTARIQAPANLSTFGLLVPLEHRNGQQQRRQALIKQFGFHDTAIDAASHLCFDPENERIEQLRVVPWDEFYYEAFEALLDEASSQGVREMATGNGGDELCMLLQHEKTERLASDKTEDAPRFLTRRLCEAYMDTQHTIARAPLALQPSSALSAAAASAPLFTRKGIWSLSPLCAPELIRLCRRLPREWRQNRRLWREYLSAHGVSSIITHPAKTEDFGGMMEASLRARTDYLDLLFKNSFLADAGMLDATLLRKDFQSWSAGTLLPYDISHFMFVVNIELSLRSLCAHSGRAQRVIA